MAVQISQCLFIRRQPWVTSDLDKLYIFKCVTTRPFSTTHDNLFLIDSQWRHSTPIECKPSSLASLVYPFLLAPVAFDLTAPNKGTVTFHVFYSVHTVITSPTAHFATTIGAIRCLIARSTISTQYSIPGIWFAEVRRVDDIHETWRRRSSAICESLFATSTAR